MKDQGDKKAWGGFLFGWGTLFSWENGSLALLGGGEGVNEI